MHLSCHPHYGNPVERLCNNSNTDYMLGISIGKSTCRVHAERAVPSRYILQTLTKNDDDDKDHGKHETWEHLLQMLHNSKCCIIPNAA
jgi:hypothetical protein